MKQVNRSVHNRLVSGEPEICAPASATLSDLPDIDFFQQTFEKYITFHHKNYSSRLREKYGTRLNSGVLNFLDMFAEFNDGFAVLDLGCGSGGNRIYLNEIGITNVTSFDMAGTAANTVGNAHALPFKSGTFHLVLSTAVIEHLQNPFLGFEEIARVLKPGGYMLATVSFWERWHDNSCFHLTPTGLYVLSRNAGFGLISLWSGWGFIESVLCHAVSIKLRRIAFFLQTGFESALKFLKGPQAVSRHRLRTSGSFGFFLKKL